MNGLATIFDPLSADAWAERINACLRDSVEAIFNAGRLIAEAKEALPHGEFRAMCEEKLPFGMRKAQMLMAVAADARLSNAQRVALLPANWGALYDLTRLNDEQLETRFEDGTINPAMERKAIGTAVKQTTRATKEQLLGASIQALPQKRYGVIVADPEWRFEPWSRLTGMDRAADNHYPTSCTEVIAARDVPSIAAKDCVLFLCATAPMLPHALLVMAAWGFDYKSNYVLKKDRAITGYWNRNKHEHLLIGTRGDVPCPAPGQQWESLIDAPVNKHSAKPVAMLEMIEQYFPTLPKIELNRRGPPREGWDAWGNEVSDDSVNDKRNVIFAESNSPNRENALTPAQPAAMPEFKMSPDEIEANGGGMSDEDYLPAFLKRKSDNSIPDSVPVVSPRVSQLDDAGSTS